MRALSLVVDAAAWPALEAALEAAGAVALTQSDGDAMLFDEPDTVTHGSWSRFRIEALFDRGADIDSIAAIARRRYGAAEVSVRELEDTDWVRHSQQAWTPRAFAGGLVVCPSWCEPPADARHLLILDPGQAFGTGTHETTTLCLEWLADLSLDGKTVIDYGCGSGILAMAAAQFGAARVHAIDIDAQAVTTAADNVAANRLDDRVQAGLPASVATARADCLVANILLEPLLGLADTFAGLVRGGGALALAGVLEHQAATVLEAYASAFTMTRSAARGDWVLLSGTRHAR